MSTETDPKDDLSTKLPLLVDLKIIYFGRDYHVGFDFQQKIGLKQIILYDYLHGFYSVLLAQTKII